MVYEKALNAIREHGFLGAKDYILTSKKYGEAERAALMAAYVDLTYMLRYGKSIRE